MRTYNLITLNKWFQTSLTTSNKIVYIDLIYESFRRLLNLFETLLIPIKLEETMWKHYSLFIAMYSLPDFKIQLQSSFRTEKDKAIMDAYTTLYGDKLLDFIRDEQLHFNKYGIDILQKNNNNLFLEFVLFTLKHIDQNKIQFTV